MAHDAFTKPEVPDSFRDLMRVSIEQAKRAFDTFAATSEKTWKTFETSSQTASSGLRSLNEKIAEITRNNAEANFALRASSPDQGRSPGTLFAMPIPTRRVSPSPAGCSRALRVPTRRGLGCVG
jgi:hypothetical protein